MAAMEGSKRRDALSGGARVGRFLVPLAAFLFGACTAESTERADAGGRTEEDAAAGRVGGDHGAPGLSGVKLEDPVAKPAFTLTDVSDGEPFRFREETEGVVTLLFIGYTHCPDICPVHMANLAAVMRELPGDVARRVRVVFISSDPERDSPARIREWLSTYDRSFIGLRGRRADVQAIEASLGLPSSVVDSGSDGDDYFVGHAAQVLAFGMDDTARVAYPWGTRQRDWIRDLPRLVAGQGS